jgi:hypothetical protein
LGLGREVEAKRLLCLVAIWIRLVSDYREIDWRADNMEKFANKKFRTFTKVTTDIVAGGNLMWETYHEKLCFGEEGIVELVRVSERSNAGALEKEICLMRGTYSKPQVGRYDIDVEFKNNNQERLRWYCGKLVDTDKLICEIAINPKFGHDGPYQSEIFYLAVN